MTARARLLACLLPAALAAPGCDIGISAGGLEGTFDRDLAVSGPLELEVTSGSGDIHIRTGADGTVHVHGRDVRHWPVRLSLWRPVPAGSLLCDGRVLCGGAVYRLRRGRGTRSPPGWS